MQYNEININPEELKKELISVYSDFLNIKTKQKSLEKAKELDGLWSGSFLLEKGIETAISNLTSFYTEPQIKAEKVKEILADLKKI